MGSRELYSLFRCYNKIFTVVSPSPTHTLPVYLSLLQWNSDSSTQQLSVWGQGTHRETSLKTRYTYCTSRLWMKICDGNDSPIRPPSLVWYFMVLIFSSPLLQLVTAVTLVYIYIEYNNLPSTRHVKIKFSKWLVENQLVKFKLHRFVECWSISLTTMIVIIRESYKCYNIIHLFCYSWRL